jgi:hypothetical protein
VRERDFQATIVQAARYADQLECLALLQAAGIPARIVRPADFDEVLAELQEAG